MFWCCLACGYVLIGGFLGSVIRSSVIWRTGLRKPYRRGGHHCGQ